MTTEPVNKGGAPLHNVNSFRTGVRMGRRNFVLADLGKDYAVVGQHLRRLRAALETQALQTHGVLSLEHQDRISLALRHEQTSLLATKRIRDGKSTDVVGDAKTAAWAAQRRSEAIRGLKLGTSRGDAADEWAEVDRVLALEAVQGDDHDDPGADVQGVDPADDRPSSEASEDDAADPEVARQWEEVDEAIRQGR